MKGIMKAPIKKPQAALSLTAALTIAFLTFGMLVLSISSGLQLLSSFQTQQAIISSNQQLVAQEAAKAVSSFIQEKSSVLETAIWLTEPATMSPAEQKLIVESLLGLQPAFYRLALLNPQDQVLAQATRLSQESPWRLTDQLSGDVLARLHQKEEYISPVYIDPASSEPRVIMAVPVTDVLGDFKGSLVAEVNLRFIWDLVSNLKVGETGHAYVVDRQGNLIAFGDTARVLKGENVSHLQVVSEFIHSPTSAHATGVSTYPGITGAMVVGTYVPLGTPDWAVVTELPWQEAYREVIRQAAVSIGITLAMAVLAGMMGVYLARRLAVPMIHLMETATRIAGGERELQAVVSGPKEAASLAMAFNSMTVQLRQSMESLEQRAQELATLNTLGQRVGATISLDQVVQAAIGGVAGATQCDLALFFLREDGELMLQGVGPLTSPFAGQDTPAYRVGERLCGLAVSEGKPVFFRDLHGDPRCIWEECRKAGLHSFAALPLYSGDEVVGALGLASATERDFGAQATFLETMANQIAAASQNALLHKQVQRHADELEQHVAERTAQLESTNKELEAFAYSVSHDLRAPLRAIDGFTRILVEDYGPSLDAEGERVCAVISNNTRRMGQLIDDLLAFSRLSRADMQSTPIDMEALAEAAFRQLTTPESRERIEFRRGRLPPAVGDPTLIGQVWMNLLSNALKFSSGRERAIVEVGCQSSDGERERVYYVRDNGAGFDMRYAGKLFGVFQRLHSEREFEGTGVGLAIVQRMIHRHGGRVWGEGEVDKGATFFFTLPQRGN
jgi:signal transduction histidine kinase